MLILPNDTILFTGDSITDCGRDRLNPAHLGFGYVNYAAAQLQSALASPELTLYNRGISGNRAVDLVSRAQADLVALKPTVISILIGINDTSRAFDSNNPTSAEVFEANYRSLLTTIENETEARIVLLEPFLLHVPEDRHAWRNDLNPKIDVVRKLAVEFGTELIALDGIFAKAATQAPAAYWAADGVHPTAAGHALMAESWLENADLA